MKVNINVGKVEASDPKTRKMYQEWRKLAQESAKLMKEAQSQLKTFAAHIGEDDMNSTLLKEMRSTRNSARRLRDKFAPDYGE